MALMGNFYSRVYTSYSQKDSKRIECSLNKEGFRYDRNCENGIILKHPFGIETLIEFKY